jgi:hypothetical protein
MLGVAGADAHQKKLDHLPPKSKRSRHGGRALVLRAADQAA